jgi:transposase-like protein
MPLRTSIIVSDLLKDFEKVPIKCPKCNRSYRHKVGRVRQNPNLKCPTCRAAFTVDAAGVDDGEMSSAG